MKTMWRHFSQSKPSMHKLAISWNGTCTEWYSCLFHIRSTRHERHYCHRLSCVENNKAKATHSWYSPLYISSALLSTNAQSRLVEQTSHCTELPENMSKNTGKNVSEGIGVSQNEYKNSLNVNTSIDSKGEHDKLFVMQEKEDVNRDDVELLIQEILERIPWAPQVIRVNTLYCRTLLLDSNYDETVPCEPHDKRKGNCSKDQNNVKHGKNETIDKEIEKTKKESEEHVKKRDESIASDTSNTITRAQASTKRFNRRKLIRKHFTSTQKLLYSLQRCNATHHYNVFVSFDWSLVTRALNASEAAACFAKFYCMPRQMPSAENGVYVIPKTSNSSSNNNSTNSGFKDFITPSSSMAITKMQEYESLEKWKDWWTSLLVQDAEWKATEGKSFPLPPTSRLSSVESQSECTSSTSATLNKLSENYCNAEKKSEGERAFITDLRALVRQWPFELTTPLNEIYIPYFGDDFIPPPLMEQAMLQSLETPDKNKKTATLVSSSSSSESSSEEGEKSEESSSSKTNNSSSSSTSAQAKIFTAEMLVPLLPTYFIPIEKLLSKLPEGYTTEHIHKLFGATDAIEMVTLQNKTFVRLYGGRYITMRPVFDFDTSGEGAVVHDEYRECYQPNPFLCYAFAPCFARPLEWKSLRSIITHAPTHIQRQLGPFQNYLSLLYFAQMQHYFQFDPHGDGSLCRAVTYSNLREITSPLPSVFSELIMMLKKLPRLQWTRVTDIEESVSEEYTLSDFSKRVLIMYFGGLRPFLASHPRFFILHIDRKAEESNSQQSTNKKSECNTNPNKVEKESTLRGENCNTKNMSMANAKRERNDLNRNNEADSANKDDNGIDLSKAKQEAEINPSTSQIQIWAVADDKENYSHTRKQNNETDSDNDDQNNDNQKEDVVVDKAKSARFFSKLDEPIYIGNCDGNADDEQLKNAYVPQTMSELFSDNLMVSLADYSRALRGQKLTLEEKLEHVIKVKDKRRELEIRRKLALKANPDSPYGDKNLLTEAILRFLPENKPILIKHLFELLPTSISDFLPAKPRELLVKAGPDKVQLFEWRIRGRIYAQRPHLPLPDGALRSNFTTDEMVYLIASVMTNKPAMMACIYGDLPFGAKMGISDQFKNLTVLMRKYPQYFILINQGGEKESGRGSNTLAALLKKPPIPPTLSPRVVQFLNDTNISPDEVNELDESEFRMMKEELKAKKQSSELQKDELQEQQA